MLKVIIADDEQLICRLVQALADWDALGMEVAGTAENGLEALALIEQTEPDILITDIRMPGCNGLDLIQRAKAARPQLEVVIISGYAHFEYAQSAIQYGVGNYLLKPIKQEELMSTLRKMKRLCEERMDRQEGILRNERESLNAMSLLRNSFVKDLLAGSFEKQTAQKLWGDCAGEGQADIWQVFLLQFDCDVHSMPAPAVEILQEKAKEMVVSVLQKECEDALLYFQGYTGYGVLRYRRENRASVRKGLRECLNLINAKKDLFGAVRPSMGLGGAVDDPAELKGSLQDAKTAVMERLTEGTGRLLEEIPAASGADMPALLQKYVKAAEHAIETLDAGEADEICAHLEQSVRENGMMRGRETLWLVTAAGEAFLTRIASHRFEEVRQDFLLECGQCGSTQELFDVLRQLQTAFIRQAGESRSSEASRPIREAKQYVMQHFREALTLEEVCEAIGFSPSYFSALFKKETGEGFAKYLTRIRVEEAKTLLRETNIPVAEICENVGYSDRKHFTHTFHRATGLNPAQYRKLYG